MRFMSGGEQFHPFLWMRTPGQKSAQNESFGKRWTDRLSVPSNYNSIYVPHSSVLKNDVASSPFDTGCHKNVMGVAVAILCPHLTTQYTHVVFSKQRLPHCLISCMVTLIASWTSMAMQVTFLPVGEECKWRWPVSERSRGLKIRINSQCPLRKGHCLLNTRSNGDQ